MPVDLISPGLTKARILDMAQSFEADGLATHRGIPFIYNLGLKVVLYIGAVNSEGKRRDYRILRAIDAISTVAKTKSQTALNDPSFKKSLNLSLLAADAYPVGPYSGRKLGVGYIYVTNFDTHLGSGLVMFFAKTRKDGTAVTKSIDYLFPSDEKLIGFIPKQATTYDELYTSLYIAITVATTGDVTDGTTYTNCKWRYFDPESKFLGGVSNTNPDYFGDVVGSVTIDTFGFGSSAVFGSTCSVAEWKDISAPAEGDGVYIWTANANSDTNGEVELWAVDGTTKNLELVSSVSGVDGITDGSNYPAKPAIYLSNENAIIVAGNIVYAYKRQTIAGVDYVSTSIGLSDIFGTEAYATGLFDSVDVSREEAIFEENIYIPDDDTITGAVISGSVRETFDTICRSLSMEVKPKGYGIIFKRINDTSVVTIPWEHIGSVEGSDASGEEAGNLNASRVQNTDLPRSVTFNYQDPYRLFSKTQSQSKFNTAIAMTDEELTLPFFITKAAADDHCRNLLLRRWIERDTYEITLPFIYAYLEPGDVVTIYIPFDDSFTTLDCRVVRITFSQNGTVTLALTSHKNFYAYPDNIAGESDDLENVVAEDVQIAESVFLDIPAVDDFYTDSKAVPIAGFPLNPALDWVGGKIKVYQSEEVSSASPNYATDLSPNILHAVGICENALAASDGVLIDRSTTLTLTLFNLGVSLESVTDMTTTDISLFAYGSELYGWEICKYETATLIDADTNTYELSGFLRGLYGTEYMTGVHLSGDTFVLLRDLSQLTLFNHVYGSTLFSKTMSGGQDDSSVQYRDVAYSGVNYKPYSCCNATASRNGSGDITVEWMYRARYDNGWEDGGDVAISDFPEAYDIDVMDGATVVRTIDAGSTTFTYLGSAQTTDFGSLQPSITFRIYQLSAEVGRGTVYEVTL
jgi:hypothetical protein